jgi:hypothetical protein
MNHLSEQELFEYIDSRPGALRDDAARHLAECETCRQTIALHRKIGSDASHAGEGIVSKDFTKRIMRDIRTPHAPPRFSGLIENSANIVAMVFVVGIITCIIYIAAQSTPDAGESVYARQFETFRTMYVSAMNSLTAHNRETLGPVAYGTQDSFSSVFWTGIAALVVLGSLDKLRVFSRIFKTR